MSEKSKKVRFNRLKRRQVRKFYRKMAHAKRTQTPKPNIRPGNQYLGHLVADTAS